MKRVTILFDDERLYQQVKAEAAREGRPVKDAVAEALRTWLHRRSGLGLAERERRQRALRLADELRSRQPQMDTIEDTLAELREERS